MYKQTLYAQLCIENDGQEMVFSKKFKLNKVLLYIYDNTYIIVYPIQLFYD